ncbi:hypothetical protein B0E46_06255 [Rhodanobacter sp. B04]|uniref:DUF1345 domain-containing protein n=1 Tax=Rhodanobacter sp. B04 TaxID=1945860 RepID=UPI0009865CAD|nr:DUF1345 domain-containing protein [Rhodanobacter sp. B04]OOG64985.1 hypothetical protein B0E46_06255 [Rhodanobacter sp. B04]
MNNASPPDDASVAAQAQPRRRRWRPFHFIKVRPRMVVSLVIFIITSAALVASGLRPTIAVLLGFDLGALVFLAILARMFNQASPTSMRTQAQEQDTGRWGILWSGVVLSTVVLVALSNELHAAKAGGALAIGVGALSVVLSWLFLNTMFAIHYAHGFYGDFGDKHSGLDFPDTAEPDYWDFAYFAIVIGMTFQVSDVQITSRYLRRVALLHSVIAFFFNVFIIAITVNIVAGLGGS